MDKSVKSRFVDFNARFVYFYNLNKIWPVPLSTWLKGHKLERVNDINGPAEMQWWEIQENLLV